MEIHLNKIVSNKKKSFIKLSNSVEKDFLNSDKFLMECAKNFLLYFEMSNKNVLLFTIQNGKRYNFANLQINNFFIITKILFRTVDRRKSVNVQFLNLGKFFLIIFSIKIFNKFLFKKKSWKKNYRIREKRKHLFKK